MSNLKPTNLRNSVLLSEQCINWAKANGHADEAEAAITLRAAWKAYQATHEAELRFGKLSKEQISARITRMARLQTIYEQALASK